MSLLDLFRKKQTRTDYETALWEKEHRSGVLDKVKDLFYNMWGGYAVSSVLDSSIDEIDLQVVGRAEANYNQAKKKLDRLHRQGEKEAIKLNRQYDTLITKLGKDAKEVYDFEGKKLGMHQKSENSGLVAITSILGIVAGIFFLSPNLTGNVVANLTQTSSNIIGVVLFAVGIIGAFFCFKRRK